jgi:hypothetical protein
LHLTGSPSVQVAGDHPADFIVTSQPSETLGPGQSTTFDVVFHPATTGLRRAILSIGSDDADEPLYQFAVEGLGTDDVVPLAVAQNVIQPLDVDGNSAVSPRDALLVVNALLRQSAAGGVTPLSATAAEAGAATVLDPFYYLDVDGNGAVSPRDALLVINHLLRQSIPGGAAAALAASPSAEPAASAVQVFVIDEAISQLEAPAAAPAPVSARSSTGEPAPVARAAEAKTLLALPLVEATFALGDDDEAPEDFGMHLE